MSRTSPVDVVPAGQKVVVDRTLVEKPKLVEIAPSTLNKIRPKKELSEKQKENLQKLIERNKQKALERRHVVEDAIPESIPEDKVVLTVKPKRAYTKRLPPTQPTLVRQDAYTEDDETEEEDEEDEVVEQIPQHAYPSSTRQSEDDMFIKMKPKPKPKQQQRYKTDEYYSYEPSEPYPPQAPRARATKVVSSDTSEYDDSSSEDERYVQKYVQKTERRLNALKDIEKKMAAARNPYSRLSIF